MISEMAEKIMVIPAHWEINKITDTHVSVNIAGHTQMDIPLAQFSTGALRQVRAILLGKIHALVMQRASTYKHIAVVNGELDRRVNEKTVNNCRDTEHRVPTEPERI
jgi:hypothetical protein